MKYRLLSYSTIRGQGVTGDFASTVARLLQQKHTGTLPLLLLFFYKPKAQVFQQVQVRYTYAELGCVFTPNHITNAGLLYIRHTFLLSAGLEGVKFPTSLQQIYNNGMLMCQCRYQNLSDEEAEDLTLYSSVQLASRLY